MELGLNLGDFLVGADSLVGVDCLAPRGARCTGIANRARDLAELAQHFGVEQSVLCTLRFVNRYPQRGDALVERATLAFDRRANLECARSGEMVAATLCLVERFRAAVIGRIETTESNPNLGEVEPDHVLDNGVVAIHRDGEAALEISARLLEVPDLGVKDSEV